MRADASQNNSTSTTSNHPNTNNKFNKENYFTLRFNLSLDPTPGSHFEHRRHYELLVNLQFSNGSRRVTAMFFDTTENYENIRLKEASEYKTRILASVSHELRTPLNGSMGLLEAALSDSRIPEEAKTEYLRSALECSKLLLYVVSDILDYSQLSTKNFKLCISDCHIGEMIEELINLLRLPVRQKRIELIKDIDPKFNAMSSVTSISGVGQIMLTTDRARLLQILLNLLSNAVKHTFEGFVKISAKITDEHTSPLSVESVCFTVQDSGVGLSMENASSLSRTLAQAEEDEPDEVFLSSSKGCGLGLTMAAAILKMLGGSAIQLKSEQGVGSSFWFSLPLRRIPVGEGSSSHSMSRVAVEEVQFDSFQAHANKFMMVQREVIPVRSERRSGTLALSGVSGSLYKEALTKGKKFPVVITKSVLIADDNDFNIETLRKMILRIAPGTEIDAVYNGLQCIEVVKARRNNNVEKGLAWKSPYEIIFMDCDMPVMDGIEATKRLKELAKNGELPDIPVIACTAYSFQTWADRCKEAGMVQFLAKPINFKQLQLVLSKYVKV